jgi:hypothetical protein
MGDATFEAWIVYLELFKDHPAMQAVNAQAIRDRDRNSAFLSIAKQRLG